VALDSARLQRPAGTRVEPTLIVTARPDSFNHVMRAAGTVGTPLSLFGGIDARPLLVGVELPATADAPAARTRYAIVPPAPLSAMRAGERAISDIVVLNAPADGSDMPSAPNDLLPAMRSTTLAAGTPRFGVYWETYGLAPTDSVEIAVWVERFTPQGIFRNLGIALNVARDRNTPVAHTWTETRADQRAFVIPGAVPVVGRSIVIDASALVPGEYWLDVVVKKPGADPIRARRTITVIAP
jgi:hypothetical protein